jgi:peptidoglycan/xylan/chitin deacetylase (PgdA/CDA1 family)
VRLHNFWRTVTCGLFLSCASLTAASRQVAITMDDLDMNSDDTPMLSLDQRNSAILKSLKDAHIKATLFVCGMRVDNVTGMAHLKQWSRAGHLIANHTYSHQPLGRVFAETFIDDIVRNDELLHGISGYARLFRFPELKEGRTAEQRDRVRSFLATEGYKNGYVTIDSSDWAIDKRLRDRLRADPSADISAYRAYYLQHIWDRAQYYDKLAVEVLDRSPKHTLLIHHNLLNALFLPDLIRMFRKNGWMVIDAKDAFSDPVFARASLNAPAGESIIWGLAKETGRYDETLRYPGEDDVYENPAMDARGL